jgi:hypothetical protein
MAKILALPAILTALFSQIGRDLGKRKEPGLFARWKGMPTDRILLSAETFLDPTTLDRYKTKLLSLLPNLALPTPAYELQDRDGSIQIYRSCTNFLRERTRDQNSFPLVYAENVNYGFRRNLWGMKPAGIAVALISLCGLMAVLFFPAIAIIWPIWIIALVFNVSLLVFWIFRITPNWVRVPAEEYARQEETR